MLNLGSTRKKKAGISRFTAKKPVFHHSSTMQGFELRPTKRRGRRRDSALKEESVFYGRRQLANAKFIRPSRTSAAEKAAFSGCTNWPCIPKASSARLKRTAKHYIRRVCSAWRDGIKSYFFSSQTQDIKP